MKELNKKPGLLKIKVSMFLLVWCVSGIFINSENQNIFLIHQMGVEAFAERGTFFLDGSLTDQFKNLNIGDVFIFDGHHYAAKQPGLFFVGSIFYFVLEKFGISYAGNYLLASSLVTFFTGTLFTALTALFIFNLVVEWSKPGSQFIWPLVIALIYSFTTIALPYSGIPHHDVLATGLLTGAAYFLYVLGHDRNPAPQPAYSTLAGALLGLTITSSMLPFFVVLVAGVYFLSFKKWKLVPTFFIGGLLGIAPLLFYNYQAFGNPFMMPNIAGNFDDTFFFLDLKNAIKHVNFYLIQILRYLLILPWGIAGLFWFPERLRREKFYILGALGILSFYITNIETLGGCQYGPRYLLPVLPLAMLGLVGFQYTNVFREKPLYRILFLISLLYSGIVNLVGVLNTSMYCQLLDHGFLVYLEEMSAGKVDQIFPLAKVLLLLSAIVMAYLLSSVIPVTRREKDSAEPI